MRKFKRWLREYDIAIVLALWIVVLCATASIGQYTSDDPTTTSASCTSTSSVILPRNINRYGFVVFNNGAATAYVSATCPATTSIGTPLVSGANWYLNREMGSWGAFCCITSSGTGDLRITQAFTDSRGRQ